METEHKTSFMIMKMFYTYRLISTHFTLVLAVKGKGKYNNIFNVPLPAGTTSENYMNALDRVLDKLEKFKPEFLILVWALTQILLILWLNLN